MERSIPWCPAFHFCHLDEDFTLIKSILNSIYTMSSFKIPKEFCDQINSIVAWGNKQRCQYIGKAGDYCANQKEASAPALGSGSGTWGGPKSSSACKRILVYYYIDYKSCSRQIWEYQTHSTPTITTVDNYERSNNPRYSSDQVRRDVTSSNVISWPYTKSSVYSVKSG